MEWLQAYWCISLPTKPLDVVHAERYLFALPRTNRPPLVLRFHRLYIFIASFLAQLCAGILYATVVVFESFAAVFFEDPDAIPGALRSLVVGVIAYCIIAAFLTPLLERRGPRWSMLLGTSFVVVGYLGLEVALLARLWPMMHVGLLFSSVGLGIVLLSSMSTAQKWAPDLRGTISGLCSLGFSLGQPLWTWYFETLEDAGVPLQHYYWYVLAVMLPLLSSARSFSGRRRPTFLSADVIHDEFLKVGMTLVNFDAIRRHSNESGTADAEVTTRQYHEQVKALTLMQCVFSTDFVCLCMAYVALSALNLPYIPLAAPGASWANDYAIADAASLKLHGALLGFAGRLGVPMVSDAVICVFYANPAFARKVTFVAVLLLPVVALPICASDFYSTVPAMIYVTKFCGGAAASLIVCFLTDMYGVYNMGTMFGFAWSIWATVLLFVAPLVKAGVDGDTLRVFWALCLAGLVLLAFVRTTSRDRFYDGYRLSLCGKSVVDLPFGARNDDDALENDELRPPTIMSPERGSFFIYEIDSDHGFHKVHV
ncbi:hypothetical protein SPRG_09218 [Saprolegnia parasitica CBS 223.65]|uniref:Major facilitator superfamily (MFS) profile domain-containing protein n=1 Tax=Saprolegnia parasitica (strain CBS 223.65) TaxID=695850 RepID=A0A067C3H6_SAPPC|nr:hypothetical protein SPRG_09218 [Saprolegnia parasitica CBS 223.65]KDO25078.1 hypothetical protein SPRG_09218 [Saprolegnia parasitica CBS 223.65]|eukprot:XP_012204152.1 hypothetical protein SPRG_09218 [Saprolegnia parasitica CBS 223.65]